LVVNENWQRVVSNSGFSTIKGILVTRHFNVDIIQIGQSERFFNLD